MADMMNFPKRWEDFMHDYEFEDARRIYTNGSRLIPSFRVKQMMEHYAPVVHGKWNVSGGLLECQNCGEIYSTLGGNEGKAWNYCPYCGARMDGDSDG